MRSNYRAPWDLKLIAITSVLLVFFGEFLFLEPGFIPSAILWSIILGCAAFGVYGYSIQPGELKILRLGWSKDIALASIKKVEVQPNVMLGSIRTFAIGGLFGYIGNFKNSIIGSYRAYATHGKNAVLIETDRQRFVVTPDDPEAFAEALNQRLQELA